MTAYADVPVRVQARAQRDEVAGARAGALLIRVSAPPVEGRANAAVCRVIAKAIGVAPSRVELLRGHGSRDKVVRIHGIEAAQARAALGLD
jgi:uncharacterized protein (TIGR00251 family)